MITNQAVFIEAGHGKKRLAKLLEVKDPGAVSVFGQERTFAKEIATRILEKLQAKQAELGLIQGVGIITDATIQKKMAFVNAVMNENHLNPQKCVGVAIHMNSGKGARGFEVWHQKKVQGAQMLANHLVVAWREYNILPLRKKPINSSAGSRFKRFYIDDTSCPYIIIEVGFMQSVDDIRAINHDMDRVAEAITHGIMEFVRSYPPAKKPLDIE